MDILLIDNVKKTKLVWNVFSFFYKRMLRKRLVKTPVKTQM